MLSNPFITAHYGLLRELAKVDPETHIPRFLLLFTARPRGRRVKVSMGETTTWHLIVDLQSISPQDDSMKVSVLCMRTKVIITV